LIKTSYNPKIKREVLILLVLLQKARVRVQRERAKAEAKVQRKVNHTQAQDPIQEVNHVLHDQGPNQDQPLQEGKEANHQKKEVQLRNQKHFM